ncbi:arginine repressor [Mordavella massiliensis]|uniref:Arginine repressor n=1 Tax=Mordavella massiliensis TaxID=1871024 RepID=A0A939BG75_9CLOT|nr:arginine repressor [Mordavella massiliensis]MBM6947411.1 arginine repressor [Mordavella massiliensis]
MKINRHAKIVELINKYHIETQEELADYLNREGFKVTQATVSRDIRDLKLTKVPTDDGKQRYAVHQQAETKMSEKYIRVLRDGFASMDKAQNILVIRTVVGMANAVCAALDAMEWKEIIGSVAGDDTIICVVRSEEDTVSVMDKIKKIVS